MTCDNARIDASAESGAHASAAGFSPAGEPSSSNSSPETRPMGGRGIFVTFEGGDGAGKTTHIAALARALESQGREVVRLREPGGTSIGEALRGIVLDAGNAAMCDECELLIYEAARAQLVAQVIRPALERGAVVLCDRFFDSTMAYQGYGRGLSRDFVRAARSFACAGIEPNRTVLLVAPSARDGLSRATRHAGADRMEQAGEAFHERVREGFARIARERPARVRVVESAAGKAATSQAVFDALADVFPGLDAFDAADFLDATEKGDA